MEPEQSSATAMTPEDGAQHKVSVLLFGDLTNPFEDDLRQLLHRNGNGTLQTFFEQLGQALRLEIMRLPTEQQAWVPNFNNLIDLIDSFSGTTGAEALKCGLLCAYQIGRFIESDHFPEADRSFVLGVCTGSFAAAAVAVSRTMADLVPLGVQAALVAFRTGLHSLKLQREIEKGSIVDAKLKSWSIVAGLSEVAAQEKLHLFNSESKRSISSQAYLSAVSHSSVTISGPPGVLQHLVESCTLKAHALSIYSPYHAAHLVRLEDVDTIISCDLDISLSRRLGTIPFLSIASGQIFQNTTFSSLLRQAVEESLCHQVRWDTTSASLASILNAKKDKIKACVITPIASSAATQLGAALQRATSLNISTSNQMNTKLEQEYKAQTHGRLQDSKIAIVGYSGRFPEAPSSDAFWQILKDARDCHRTIPPDRFDWAAHYDPKGKLKNHTRVKFGCFINEPGLFDARFFNLSPREAENTDPAQRLLMMSAYEAMEMAGLVPDRTPSTRRDRIGVFMGVTSDDWREVNSGQDIDTYFIPGGNRAFVPGRISYFFRLSGPSISVDTACSSSFAAISTACNYLWRGDCDSAIAGGTNVLTNPDNFVGLDRGHFLSTTGNCNPFDDAASGYCRADAVGAVILKRLEDAIADRDPIFGVIAGASTNHCGQSVSITRPNEADQLLLFQHILRQTNTNPNDVGYCEMHGTGTQAGDAAEMQSVMLAMAPGTARRDLPLYLGAVKANIGHSESASGVTALIKVLLMMKYNEIPRQRVDGELNRHYPTNMTDRNIHIALKRSPWRREDARNGRRVAFLNNFSAAGGNTALLLEDAPADNILPANKDKDLDSDMRSYFPITVTAKTREALQANVHALVSYMDEHDTPLSTLSYTTTARRTHYRFRASVVVDHQDAVRTSLLKSLDSAVQSANSKGSKLSVPFVFTGQGNYNPGMGKQLFDQLPSFREDIISYDRIAQSQSWPSIIPWITEPAITEELESNPEITHLGFTCLQMALSRLWTRWYGQPSSVIGHSLGEYAALFTAGVMSASDTIYLVGSRAALLNRKCVQSTYAMLALKAGQETVETGLRHTSCIIACINSPTSTVVSGPKDEITALADSFRAQSVDAVLLNLPFAFHSSQVDPILEDLQAIANTVQYNKPNVPYISPLRSEVIHEAGILDGTYLVKSTRHCVNFQGALEAAVNAKLVNDSTIWLEVGAHPICSAMIKQTLGSHIQTTCSLRKETDCWKVLVTSLQTLYNAGADIKWNEYHREFPSSQTLLQLPAYKWDLKNYWIQYRNNFCLTKGDDIATMSDNATAGPHIDASPPTSLSSSVHQIVEEKSSVDHSHLVVRSNVHDPRLVPVFNGHQVNKVVLCPSSLYADMALTMVKHMIRTSGIYKEVDEFGLDCGTMHVLAPLIAQPNTESQILKVTADAVWKDNTVTLAFSSSSGNASKDTDHANCTVKLTKKPDWQESWKRKAYLVQSRIASLHASVETGLAHKLKRGLVYRLFSSIVDFSPAYQGMEQVILDSENLEATAQVIPQVDQAGFDFHPCWIECLGHIAGFIMNGNDNAQFKDLSFVNHGWDAMRFTKEVTRDKTYTTYNRMQLVSGTTYVGDTYIFDGQECIGICEGIRFQGIKRTVLDRLLPRPGSEAVDKSVDRARPTQKPREALKPSAPVVADTVHPKSPSANNTQPRPSSKTSEVLKIICEEVQSAESEIDLDADVNDLGIDSLLSLTITSRLRDELELDVSSTDFLAHSTIREFLAFASQGDIADSSPSMLPEPEDASGTSTPSSSTRSSIEGSSSAATSVTGDDGNQTADVMAIIRKVVSDETGTLIDDQSTQISFSELGVDSLLSLTIRSILYEDFNLDIPTTVFAESETLEEMEMALRELNIISGSKADASPHRRSPSSPAADDVSPSSASKPQTPPSPSATSVILQGSSKTATTALFLFPDGAGSATSYSSIPHISPDLVVYGLNCPWLRTPDKLKCSLEAYVALFLAEVHRRQPSGPYNFGGASAGGILAYEAAQQLASHPFHRVSRLLLLDTPDPIGLQNPNDRMYDFLDSQGMFGISVAGKAPSWLRPHFTAFLALLDAYKVKKYAGSTPPKTKIVYAKDGMCKNAANAQLELREDDPREMRWLVENRTDFSGAGWNSLVGKENLEIEVLEDVNHYTILQDGPKMEELCGLIAKAMGV